MWKKILAGVLVVIVAFLGFVATRPDSFRVERSIVVQAPPEVLFSIVNDFRNGAKWSPWEKLDPNMKKTFSGPQTGVGSVYEWEGNDEVGKGRQEITLVEPPNKVVSSLHFIKPFEAHNEAEFLFVKEGEGTRVTWAISGPSPFISKLFGVFMDMDKMIGKDFEKGLADLKKLAESQAKAP
jgi:uncharacterized protein YndB with AHSA1/START domain